MGRYVGLQKTIVLVLNTHAHCNQDFIQQNTSWLVSATVLFLPWHIVMCSQKGPFAINSWRYKHTEGTYTYTDSLYCTEIRLQDSAHLMLISFLQL